MTDLTRWHAPELTDEKRAELVSLVREGLPYATVSGLSRVPLATLFAWRRRAGEGEEPYASLFVDLVAAEAEVEQTLIRRATDGDRGAQWVLARRWPRRWSQRVREAVNDELDLLVSRLRGRLAGDVMEQVLAAMEEET